MQTRYLGLRQLLQDFLPLIVELECGCHCDGANTQHVEWITRRIGVLYAMGGDAICLCCDQGNPMDLLFLTDDRRLEGVRCSGKKGTIAMFGLFPKHRSKRIGASLLRETEMYLMKTCPRSRRTSPSAVSVKIGITKTDYE